MKKYKGLLLFLICCLVVFAFCSSLRQDVEYVPKKYIVQPGDTYDILASKFSVNEDLCVWRERVKMYNGKTYSGLFVGEIIYVLVPLPEYSEEVLNVR